MACLSYLVASPRQYPNCGEVSNPSQYEEGFYEPKEGHAKVRQEHSCDQQEVQRVHGRGTSRDEGVHPRAEGLRGPGPARGQGGRGKRRAREDRRDAGAGSRHGQAAPFDHQSQRASPLAENLVRDARVCQGRRGRVLLPTRAEVQDAVRDARVQRRGEPRRRRHVAGRLRSEGVDGHRRGKDQRAREESDELKTEICGVNLLALALLEVPPSWLDQPTSRTSTSELL